MLTEPVSKQIQELEAIKKQKRFWSLGSTLLLAFIVVGCLLSLRNAANGLAQPGTVQTAFQQDLSERVQKNALPVIESAFQEGVRGVDYGVEAQKLNARTPELVKASMDQMKMLSDDLTQRGNKVFDGTFKAAMTDRDKKIRAMFPEANEQQINGLMTNLTKEAQDQVADINDSLFASHKQALDNIVTDLTLIQNSEAGSIKGESPSWEMGLEILDIAREDLKSLQPADTGKTTPSKTGSKEKKS